MVNDPEQLFELFYQDITLEMNPPGMPKWRSEGMYSWWRERFMNAYFGHQEPMALRSWAEAPQMWLAGYRQNKDSNQEKKTKCNSCHNRYNGQNGSGYQPCSCRKTAEPKPEFVPPPSLLKW